MPYLPPSVLQRTVFPEASGEDLRTTIGQIEECWEVNYPLVQYFMLNKLTTPVTTDNVANMDQLAGTPGGTQWDPLWGESNDPAQTTWVQPQGTGGSVAAADVEVWLPQVPVRARVQLITAETRLEKLGFDENDKWIGNLLVSVPTSLMDKAALYANPGDKLVWDADEWHVNTTRRSGYWHNTNISLYVNMACERRRHGD